MTIKKVQLYALRGAHTRGPDVLLEAGSPPPCRVKEVLPRHGHNPLGVGRQPCATQLLLVKHL